MNDTPKSDSTRDSGLDAAICSRFSDTPRSNYLIKLAKEFPTVRMEAEALSIGLMEMERDMVEARNEVSEAWHLLNVLCANMMDDGPTWPRVLEWLHRNESFRPANAGGMARELAAQDSDNSNDING